MTERQKLTTNPLTSHTEGINLQLKDVYVPLGLVERKKQAKRQDDVEPERGSELYQETEITTKFENHDFLAQVIKQKQTPKSKGQRIAIIGEPGAGKTTLLQQIADWLNREVEQSLVIWVSLADLRKQELRSYLLETWLNQVAQTENQPQAREELQANFISQFNEGRVCLLLDGLDEMSVSEDNPLTEIDRQIKTCNFIQQAQIVLTCRVNLWDGSRNVLDNFDIYRTLDFSYPEQVEIFIDRWFTAINNRERGQRLCEELKAPGKERIQDLVKNPLRLSLLCLNWHSREGNLPDTQAGLYQQLVDDFDKWKAEKLPKIFQRRKQELNTQLGELAKAAIDTEATRFRLRQEFVNQYLGEDNYEDSLLNLALKLGWLNQVGRDADRKPVYAFFHASFQEYFAAQAIDDWHFFVNHVPKNPDKGTYRIFEAQWKQTILLWLGRKNLGKDKKEAFIQALVTFKDGCGIWMWQDGDKGFYDYRAYFLAAAGIAEFRDCSRTDEIVNQIVTWGFGEFKTVIRDEARTALKQTDRRKAIAALVNLLNSTRVYDWTRRLATESLGQIGTGNPQAIAALVNLLNSTRVYDWTRRLATESLGQIGTGNPQAIAALVNLLNSTTVDEDTRKQAVESLGQIGTGNPQAIAALVNLLNSTTVADDTRRRAAESLEKIGTGNPQAIAALVNLLNSTTVDDYTRRWAAEILGQIGTGNPQAIAALVNLLNSTTVDDWTRRLAAQSLGQIGAGNPQAIAALVNLLNSTTVDAWTRRQAADSLGQIGTGNPQAIAALVNLLNSTTVYDWTRRQAADSLGQIGTGNPQAIAALVNLLNSTDDDTRGLAAVSLGQIDPGNPQAIAALVNLLNSTTVDDEIHRWAAYSLEKIDPGNPQAIAALEKLLNSTTVSNSTRWHAAESLGQIGAGNPQAIAALVNLLNSTTGSDYTRRQAAESLGKIDPGNPQAIAALVKLLNSTTVSNSARRQAAESLGQIGTGNPQAIAALVKLLNSTTVDDFTRRLAAESLGQIGTGNPQAIAALVNLLNSTDDDTRGLAAESLGQIDPGNPQVIAALVKLLNSTTVSNSTRWQAAYSLGKIGTGNLQAIAALVNLLNSTTVDDYTRRRAADSLGKICSPYEVVKALSGSWLLSDEEYELIWESAQNLPYPKFYQAWHESHFINAATRSLRWFLRRLNNS